MCGIDLSRQARGGDECRAGARSAWSGWAGIERVRGRVAVYSCSMMRVLVLGAEDGSALLRSERSTLQRQHFPPAAAVAQRTQQLPSPPATPRHLNLPLSSLKGLPLPCGGGRRTL
jgi:hypothetical protein